MTTKAELEDEVARLKARLAEYDENERLMQEKGEGVEFETLVGLHDLDAVDDGNVSLPRYEGSDDVEDCTILWFRLDGVAYGCIEDPNDGYRSSMRELVRWNREMKNTFAPCRVLCRIRTQGAYSGEDRCLEAIDVVTGKVVLSVGTRNVDDYYPGFEAVFSPENMAINAPAAGG